MKDHDPATRWSEIDDAPTLVAAILELYERRGTAHYDEDVTQSAHACQTADFAARAGAGNQLVAAALLHDLGHLLLDESPTLRLRSPDLRHEEVAARFLATWFGDDVTRPIRHHVDAKRYLCAVDPGYRDKLSAASVRSLELQGGPMTAAEAEVFAALAGAGDGIRLRLWDDAAKVRHRSVGGPDDYAELLCELVSFPERTGG